MISQFASEVAGVRTIGGRIIPLVMLVIPWSLVMAQPGSFRETQPPSAIVVENGYLFLNGEYIAPPYRIESKGDTVCMNDQVLRQVDFGYTESETSAFRPMARRGPMHGMRRGRAMRFPGHEMGFAQDRMTIGLFAELANLRVGDVLVLKEGSPPLTLLKTREGQDLLMTLTGGMTAKEGETFEADSTAPVTLTSTSDQEAWSHLVSGFEPSESFLARANVDLKSQQLVQQSNGDKAAANVWSNQIAYPLTVLAMVIVVLAFGHLLSHKPSVESPSPGVDDKHVRTTVLRSLLIVGLLSAIDLVWTIVASQTGSMRELNPIGNHLIHDPMQLAMFKIIAVSTSIGLLYWLHQRPVAQLASWWSCLLLTLVTARWLTFNAMFL